MEIHSDFFWRFDCLITIKVIFWIRLLSFYDSTVGFYAVCFLWFNCFSTAVYDWSAFYDLTACFLQWNCLPFTIQLLFSTAWFLKFNRCWKLLFKCFLGLNCFLRFGCLITIELLFTIRLLTFYDSIVCFLRLNCCFRLLAFYNLIAAENCLWSAFYDSTAFFDCLLFKIQSLLKIAF